MEASLSASDVVEKEVDTRVPKVVELDDTDDTGVPEKVPNIGNSDDPDSILDDIVDSIDISKLLPKEELKAKEKTSKRVLSAVKDYNPVEREKSIAKRKALEQEIVRQTEEFDRLAELSRKNKPSSQQQKAEDGSDSDVNEDGKGDIIVEKKPCIARKRMKLSKNDWVRIIRCSLLVLLGGCIGKLDWSPTSPHLGHFADRISLPSCVAC
jgi:hypothetical protein